MAFRIIYSADAEKHTKHIGKTARKGYNVKDDTPDEYYGAAEPPVRCGESHLSGLTEPPHFVY